mmetsp:Transcript_1209/g.2622  ORF Transcript_1209/g.2622 Transcript_1209/m.2622 type:complete len:113 (-) Transcript_1209:77-415(-)
MVNLIFTALGWGRTFADIPKIIGADELIGDVAARIDTVAVVLAGGVLVPFRPLDFFNRLLFITMEILVPPNLDIRILPRSRRGEPVEVELADERAPVGVLEVLGKVLLREGR